MNRLSNPEKKSENRLRASDLRRRRRLRMAAAVVGALGAVAALVVIGMAPLFRPLSTERHPVHVTIPNGSGVLGIGRELERKNVIRSATAFAWTVRWSGQASHLKAGRYILSPDMTLAQILQELQIGPGRTPEEGIRVTIPEGYTLRQIADALNAKEITDGAAFLRFATDPGAIATLHADFPLPEKTLEGYLFPDTYYFPPHSPPAKVAETMLMNFGTRFARPYQHQLEANGRRLHTVVTVASLIEREAQVQADRPRIAGVIDNRLKRNMKLQIDASVLYALGYHKEHVLNRDLEVDSPYNTYQHTGLPPGPIASPGLPSLLAALSPEPNDFLYYVARPNGTHLFTRTAAEHQAAIQQVRSERRQQNREEGGTGG